MIGKDAAVPRRFEFILLIGKFQHETDQGDKYLAIFVELDLADTPDLAKSLDRDGFLLDHVRQGIVREDDIGRHFLPFGDLAAQLAQGV